PPEMFLSLLQRCYNIHVEPSHEALFYQPKSGSGEQYGELKPVLIQQIFQDAHITSSSVFVDLGSGAGTVVSQASLVYGCKSHGIEIRELASTLADKLWKSLQARARLWGITTGEVELINGDIRNNQQVVDLIKIADLILVCNEVFPASLNNALGSLLLSMKPGVLVVSLQSLMLTPRIESCNRNPVFLTVHFTKAVKQYKSNTTNWKHAGGTYYQYQRLP
ncbi:histone methylation DOT1, partial [Rhodocollybia butyracea]